MKKARLKHAHESTLFHRWEKFSAKWLEKRLRACCWWWLRRFCQRNCRYTMTIFSPLVRNLISTINVHKSCSIGVFAGEFLHKSSELRGTGLDFHRARYIHDLDGFFTSLRVWSLATLHVNSKYIHSLEKGLCVCVS